ncbi:ABC transporter substrate-binding protein [Desulfosporosinus youngiae]|uniref:ABC-type Fe3+-hydroxamate transport system, periplasmic component n=1 Tax=Desulfosporosinus youngiae DSM 17734 TaxID=768710 RepID=H5XTJ0_9FIRM|nr:ABC transporter substrate-binding protein [Desulfosporosinus youngiae]EHQ88589.1 ABC-type Fe3+-hydroxamate transport system, periplasmic component [Desulfosporosinus youngiae DSM 17734]
MFKHKLCSLLILIVALTLLAGCGSTTPKSNPQAEVPKAQTTQTTYPLTLKDDSGASVTIASQPKRIVSLVPATTETLFALGLEENVLAVTKWDDYPADVQKKVEYVFQDGVNPNLEQILALNPDLVVMGIMGTNPKTVESIRNLNIPIFVVDPQTIEATYLSIETFGQLTDTQEQAKQLVSGMKEKQQSIAKKVASIETSDRLRVWTEVDENLFTPGQGTFLNELLTKAGGINIADDVQGWGQYNSEQVISKNPQVIFETYDYYQKDAIATILARNGWQTIDAVKNKRVIGLDNNLVSRPGPRIVDGLESISKALYPDLYK